MRRREEEVGEDSLTLCPKSQSFVLETYAEVGHGRRRTPAHIRSPLARCPERAVSSQISAQRCPSYPSPRSPLCYHPLVLLCSLSHLLSQRLLCSLFSQNSLEGRKPYLLAETYM
ncbi:hypothetical protein Fmac_002193 [Flemingia macrophylla]|uniref:Uncharacterized protein n=1 Tax=Flemingia macrophylla TaxID=520843 RepID=A0ABD1NJ79_9FABA